jgi:hypothetical protein
MILPHESGTLRRVHFNAPSKGIIRTIFNPFWMTQRYQTVGAFHRYKYIIADQSFFLQKTDQHESSSAFKLDEVDKGWVLRRTFDGPWQRMCWLPYKRRKDGVIRACYGQRIVICAAGGVLTILDFSDV